MKHTGRSAVAFLFLFLAGPLVAQPAREFQGQIFHMGENGEKIPEPGLIVTLVETGATDDANDQGVFRLPVPPAFQPGDSVTISVDKPGWRVRYPLDGEARIPRELLREIVHVELLQVGSKLFWTHDRIEKFIRDASERSKEEGKREGDAPSLDLGRDIREWAAKFGFSAREAREEIDRWVAEVETSHEDSYQRGLAAFAKQQFDTAAERFRDSAEWRIRQFDETRKQHEKLAEKARQLQEEVVRDLRLEGDSHFYAYRYEQALTIYEQAHQYTSEDQTPQLWGATLNDIGRAHLSLGIRVAAAESVVHLAAAVQAHRQALLVVTRGQLPQEWARTQRHLGNILKIQAINTAGEEGTELLVEAILAYRQAMLYYNREQMPKYWAGILHDLGDALTIQATRIAGEEGIELLEQAVHTFRQTLLVFTREQLPQAWAGTQNVLGTALRQQGTRTPGEKGARLLAQAVEAHRESLLLYTREQWPQNWAETQNRLGNALHAQERRTTGGESTRLLAQAVQAFQQALLVYTREQFPQQWAMTQNNLGLALHDQGIRTAGEEGAQLLTQAVQAYRQAMLGYTREQLPQQWAIVQDNLGIALRVQGTRTGGEEGAQLLEQAVQAHRQALVVRNREHLPLQWAITQSNLSDAIQEQGKRTSGEAGTQLLTQSVDAYQQALLVLTPDYSAQSWAEARSNQAGALVALSRYKEAVQALTQVLEKVPDYRQAFDLLGTTLNHKLFHHEEAVVLTRSWLSRHQDDLLARLALGEQLFASRAFSESSQEISPLLKEQELDAQNHIVALGYAVAAGVATNSPDASDRFKELLGVVAAQPQDFGTSWTFEGTLHSLREDPEVRHKDLLIHLFQALAAPDRDNLLKGLQEVKEAIQIAPLPPTQASTITRYPAYSDSSPGFR